MFRIGVCFSWVCRRLGLESLLVAVSERGVDARCRRVVAAVGSRSLFAVTGRFRLP